MIFRARVKHLRATRIVVAMGDRRGKLPVDALLSLKCRGLQVQDGVEVYEADNRKSSDRIHSLGLVAFLARMLRLPVSSGVQASRIDYGFYRRPDTELASASLNYPDYQADLTRTSFLSPEDEWGGMGLYSIATSFAPCAPTQRQIAGQLGPRTTIPVSLRLEDSSGNHAWMKFHNCGMC